MRRKGWSESKVGRALEDLRKAEARPNGGGSDSLELWNEVLSDLAIDLSLPYVGLLVRFYSGAIATEIFSASRREVSVGVPWQETLACLKQNEVTILR